MNEDRKEQLAEAVLDAWELGAEVDYAAAGADQAARGELLQLEVTAALAAAALAAVHAAENPMPAAFAARMAALGREVVERAKPPSIGVAVSRRPNGAPFWLGLAAGFAIAWLALARSGDADPEVRREELLATGRSASVAWQAGASKAHGVVHGDVVWCTERQEGYLRIDGLQPLPEGHQYQLWIVDAHRIGAPVDGGLFDLAKAGENVVPITARLPVRDAKAFVVTVEKRGGVVVSDQSDVVAVATL